MPLIAVSFIFCNHLVDVIPSFFLKAALKANRDLKPQRRAIASTVKYRSFFTNNSFFALSIRYTFIKAEKFFPSI